MENLKFIRERRGMTQEQLAEKLEVTRITVARYENGSRWPDREMLVRISEVLSCSVDELLGTSSAATDEIGEALKGLSADKLAQVLEYARFIANKK